VSFENPITGQMSSCVTRFVVNHNICFRLLLAFWH